MPGVDPKHLRFLPDLQPKDDPVFAYLLSQAIEGRVNVYFGAVPLRLIKPFDEKYRPQDHPAGRAAIEQVMSRWRSGRFTPVWVYPSDRRYVLSDDYITLEAARKGQPDYLPCWVLGEPDRSVVMDVQGPIDPGEIKRLLGWSE